MRTAIKTMTIDIMRPARKGKPYNVYTDDKALKCLYVNQDINQVMRQER